MKTQWWRHGIVILAGVLAGVSAWGSADAVTTAVYSSVSNGYVRPKLPDGTPKREYYALANGHYSPGAERDKSIDSVKFPQVAGVVAQYLARENYFLARDSKSADILLLITWGTTIPSADNGEGNALVTAGAAANLAMSTAAAARGTAPSADGIQSPQAAIAQAAQAEADAQLLQLQMFEDMRQHANEYNARLLGYAKEINDKNNPSRFAGNGTAYDDLISDVESERYYVVISAYDFRAATQGGKRKLLWATRVSIQTQGNRFDEQLAMMVANASRYFGRNSDGLKRRYQTEHVELGDLKILATGAEAAPDAPTPKEKK